MPLNYLIKKIADFIYRTPYLNKRIKNFLFIFNTRLIPYEDPSLDNIYKKIYCTNDELIVFDVGANRGQSIERFSNLFKNTTIYAFEPIEKLSDSLRIKYENFKRIKIFNIALGSKKQKKIFYEAYNQGASGFHKLSTESSFVNKFSKKWNIPPSDFNKKSYLVNVASLDSFMYDNNIFHINILKIDVQGYEDEVLKGAKENIMNNNIDFIEVEVNFGQLYGENNNSFSRVENNFIDNGYKLIAINNSSKNYNLLQDKDLEFDVVYAKKDIYNKILQL